jgi:hypothetical protein
MKSEAENEDDLGYLFWAKDKFGDGVIAVLDEIKFWGEVFAEYMQFDESSSRRIAAQYKEEFKKEMKEFDDLSA